MLCQWILNLKSQEGYSSSVGYTKKSYLWGKSPQSFCVFVSKLKIIRIISHEYLLIIRSDEIFTEKEKIKRKNKKREVIVKQTIIGFCPFP